MAYNFTTIEKKWQEYWLTNKSFRALDPHEAGSMPKAYVLDMFPYPSGAGLHVGHPEGYTATDIISRYLRMKGVNVLHPMGWDAFGLPAEQYAIKTNTHPRSTTEQNIANFRRQIQMLGLSYDWDREVDTTDPAYYCWTQWIFLQLFNSYFDPVEKKAMPIARLVNQLQNENYVVAPDGQIKVNPSLDGLELLAAESRVERLWQAMSPHEQSGVINGLRLAYMDEVPVNWCPALGTVLANEEVIDGKSEVGGYPVERRPMRQWMLRITAYADRLLADLDGLDWSGSLKEMQRNWIGRSAGAEVDFEVAGASPADDDPATITVFTTRPDTLYGATYMVLAPEHELVDTITTPDQREAVKTYRDQVAGKSERDRMAGSKEKTGVFTGAYAINPVNDQKIPIWIADYVLMGYGTGAIMAVPAHDDRDFEFAQKFGLSIVAVVMPPDEWLKERILADSAQVKGHAHIHNVDTGQTVTREMNPAERERAEALLREKIDREIARIRPEYQRDPADFGAAYTGDGVAINSPVIDSLETSAAKERIISYLVENQLGTGSVTYKLRDWLFSRQRYWGEPFPILLDESGEAIDVLESELPVKLPEVADFKPTGTPEPPLTKATHWTTVQRDGKTYTRETNTMPQWAGSCWYYLRYIDPRNPDRMVDPAKEKYWMPVDLYVGGVEHAVLHLLYARFWHKVLFDLGHVSTPEPFQRLVNQGLILGEVECHVFAKADGTNISAVELEDVREEAMNDGPRLVGTHKASGDKIVGQRVGEDQVEKHGERFVLKADPSIVVDARAFKMSKSRGNVVNPDEIVREYGADCLRLYEMYMGPLEAQKPWATRDIVGMYRFLNSVWRNLVGDEEEGKPSRVADVAIPDAIDRLLHKTIKKVGDDITALRFNTAIAELIKLNNELTGLPAVPRTLAETLTLLLAPFAPHIAEEIWQRLGHKRSLARFPWPVFDEAKLVETTLELPVQVNGKLRDKINVPADADEAAVFQAAESAAKVIPWIQGKTFVKKLYVPKKLVNLVVK